MALNTIDYTKTQKGPSRIYTGLAAPAAGMELTIGTDGVPDATENPLAKLVGLTEGGASCSITKTEEDEFFDEYKYPLAKTVEQTGMMIKCKAMQILDADVFAAISPGVGTQQTVTGKKKFKIGEGTITNTGIAAIAPTRADSSKYVVFHIYAGHNVSNIEFPLAKQTRAGIDCEFTSVGVPTRAKDDVHGAFWWTV